MTSPCRSNWIILAASSCQMRSFLAGIAKNQISPSPKHPKYTAKSVRRLNTARVIKNPIRPIAKHAQNTIDAFVPTLPKGLHPQGKKQPNACRPHKQRKTMEISHNKSTDQHKTKGLHLDGQGLDRGVFAQTVRHGTR
ncbi:hypothetical protein ACSF86_10245 [Moraxella bovoculi]|uniref:hypothetical protein n=1 Tax=Moraxella bovoculi TaxID=386891 RepID=UPI003F4FA171